MRLALLSTGRQDWGVLRSTYLRLKPDLIKWSNPGGSAVGQCVSAMSLIGAELERLRPEALMLVGDRYETLQGALAATVLGIPIIHLHGGETTLGAFDDQIRWAITKLAHLHLVSNERHMEAVVRSGEHPDTVHVVGAPGTDNAFRTDLLTLPQLSRLVNHPLRHPIHTYILHPETLSGVDVVAQAVRHKLSQEPLRPTTLAIMPNHDPGYQAVSADVKAAFSPVVESLSELEFWSLLKHTDTLIGNSSSLVVEAPAIGLKTVLLGDRQQGRLPPMPADGRCAERIAAALASWSPPHPPRKRHVQHA